METRAAPALSSIDLEIYATRLWLAEDFGSMFDGLDGFPMLALDFEWQMTICSNRERWMVSWGTLSFCDNLDETFFLIQ